MGLLDLFKRKSVPPAEPEESFDDSAKDDHLGKAAKTGSKAKEAVASGKFDIAWRLYLDQKQHYLQHAARCGFTKPQVLALDASVSEPMGNILRLEDKHHDALVHIVYWVAASPRVTKSQQQKLPAYFNRCRFKTVTLSDLNDLVEASRVEPDFVRIRDVIGDWRDRG
ncbi:MAG: hypothetical protein V4440_00570 [Pseudomonadota bacterium]